MVDHPDAAVAAGLEPELVWQYFAGLAAVPRPSKREAQVQAYMLGLLKELGFDPRQDATGNIVASVPATAGREHLPITVLQGHLDMVCEKNAGTVHDFDHDAIRLVTATEDGEPIIRAAGTTLGADNGIGVCLALAAATSPDVAHGPLELLLTCDEEDGMTGAKAVTPELFAGRRLINLDSEEDNALYIGCAGGCDTNLTWRLPLAPLPAGAKLMRVRVDGLRGGHSGSDIDQNRGTATKLLVRTLRRIGAGQVGLVSLAAGSKRNAIAREGEAVVAVATDAVGRVQAAANAVQTEAAGESFERDVKVTVEPADGTAETAVSFDDTDRLLRGLAAVPHGVIGMHPQVPGLVETSSNLATLGSAVVDGALHVSAGKLTRSSCESRMDEALGQIVSVAELSGAETAHKNRYPGWAPAMDSPMLAACKQAYTEMFGAEPQVAAIHAGLECGIIGERVGGGMDMISFGPRIEGAHSPDERVWPESVAKIWAFLQRVLVAIDE